MSQSALGCSAFSSCSASCSTCHLLSDSLPPPPSLPHELILSWVTNPSNWSRSWTSWSCISSLTITLPGRLLPREPKVSIQWWLSGYSAELATEGSWPLVRILVEQLWNFVNSVYPTCLSDGTLKAVGPFYLVSMPGEVKISHTRGKCVTCCGLHILI